MFSTFLAIFKKVASWIITFVTALIIYILGVIATNIPLLKTTFSSELLDAGAKTKVFFSLLGSLSTNFTVSTAIALVLVAVFSGIYTAFFTFYFRRRKKTLGKAAGVGVIGFIVALFGVGCAACGSVLLSAVIGLATTGSVLGVLPLGGHALPWVGLVLLGGAILYLLKKINDPAVCIPIEFTRE